MNTLTGAGLDRDDNHTEQSLEAARVTPEELARLRADAERFRCLPKFIAAIFWKRSRADLPLLGDLEDGFELDELRVWCDAALSKSKTA